MDLPTNRQQIMLRAARRGHEVLFVEGGHFTLKYVHPLVKGNGSRSRGARRSLASRIFATEQAAQRIRVRKDLNVLPFGTRFETVGRANARITAPLLERIAQQLPRPLVLWAYHPGFVNLLGQCGEAFAVYDCVDDYAEQTRDDPRRHTLFRKQDERVGRASRLVFATTTPLFERHSSWNPRTHLVPNTGDFGHFASAVDRAQIAEELTGLSRPVIGFAGNLLESKVDLDLVQTVAARRPDWTILLIGPAEPALERRLRQSMGSTNVRWIGARPYAQLPRFIAAFDVGVIPYASNAYTRSCFPLKLYEYLAAGKAVVATGLPELSGREPDVVVADSVDGFVAAVERALTDSAERAVRRRQAIAATNTWETRAGRLLELVEEQLE